MGLDAAHFRLYLVREIKGSVASLLALRWPVIEVQNPEKVSAEWADRKCGTSLTVMHGFHLDAVAPCRSVDHFQSESLPGNQPLDLEYPTIWGILL